MDLFCDDVYRDTTDHWADLSTIEANDDDYCTGMHCMNICCTGMHCMGAGCTGIGCMDINCMGNYLDVSKGFAQSLDPKEEQSESMSLNQIIADRNARHDAIGPKGVIVWDDSTLLGKLLKLTGLHRLIMSFW